ncbi:hypothetical protein ACN2XU_13380 [Primorskyibacter sp. 2E107]|uniref:hypothetical protein n=1 Tax=Primorskyibacter sp. 2E107 TaxID=3403458 RepID=UPI003AF671E8
MTYAIAASLSAFSASLSATQRGRRAMQVTTVTLTPSNPYGPTEVRGAELRLGESPLGTYDDPLLDSAARQPKTGTDLARDMLDHLESGGREIFDTVEAQLTSVMAKALGLPAQAEDGKPHRLSDLRTQAEAQDQPFLVAAADRFTEQKTAFGESLTRLQSSVAAADPAMTDKQRDGLVGRAVGVLVDTMLEPERLRLEIEALKGAALLKLTGASEEDQQRAYDLRRATGQVILHGKRKGMVSDMMRDYKAGRLAAVINTQTAWADQTVSVDTRKATGATVTFAETFDHFATASFSMSDKKVTARTLRML